MIGLPTVVDEADATSAAELSIMDVLPDSPAAVIPAGSVVNAVENENNKIENPTPTEFSRFVTDAVSESVNVFYTYKGEDKRSRLPRTRFG